jgi:NCS1 family nucleobase:cation symporter-1
MAETRARKSKAAQCAERLAIESEPGLTTAQLMLYNHDLAPVEPERRQWGTLNHLQHH